MVGLLHQKIADYLEDFSGSSIKGVLPLFSNSTDLAYSNISPSYREQQSFFSVRPK
jgi:hypothetical protein